MRKNTQKKNVFCLEGMWNENLKQHATIEPVLELLDKQDMIKYIHKDCATRSEMEFYLKRWSLKMYADYPILYLAFHGSKNTIHLQDDEISLNKLNVLLENKCENRVVIFGSCSTLNTDARYIKKFLRTTGALAVCGYRTDIDWIESTIYDLLLIEAFQYNEFSGRGIGPICKRVHALASRFKELRFRMMTQKDLV